MTAIKAPKIPQENKIELVDKLPRPAELPDGTILGMYSVYIPEGRIRIIEKRWIRKYQGQMDTETGFTRQWTKTLKKRGFNKPQLKGWSQSRPPLYCKPGVIEDAVYIDIIKSYPSIYKIVGWGVEYLRDSYLAVDSPLLYPYPLEWKVGYSYVVTGAIPVGWRTFVKSGRAISVKNYNENSNPCLVSATYDILGMLGRAAAYSFGARYWNIDGGIMPARSAEPFLEFCKKIGLGAGIKSAGRAVIVSAGYWKCGEKFTCRWGQPQAQVHTGDYIPLNVTQAQNLYNRLLKIQELRPIEPYTRAEK